MRCRNHLSPDCTESQPLQSCCYSDGSLSTCGCCYLVLVMGMSRGEGTLLQISLKKPVLHLKPCMHKIETNIWRQDNVTAHFLLCLISLRTRCVCHFSITVTNAWARQLEGMKPTWFDDSGHHGGEGVVGSSQHGE